jgi:aspartate/methionine/tyrosine aminotransferase
MSKSPDSSLYKIRARVGDLRHSPTLEINETVVALRDSGAKVLHMGFGESPFPVHPKIKAALVANADKNMYLPTAGLPALRKSSKEWFSAAFDFEGLAVQAVIGPGSKELIYDIQLALEGDLLLPVPSWVSYAPQASLIQDAIIKIPTTLADNYHITARSLEEAILRAKSQGLNPRKLLLNYPNNPTGLSIPARQLDPIAQVCAEHKLVVISDEIYGRVSFEGDHVSLAKFYPQGTIVTSGLSKHLSLGGYRLGVAVFPGSLSEVHAAVVRIASETWSTVSAPIQFAALEAFSGDAEIDDYIHTCTRIHSLVAGYVRKAIIGLGIPYPELQGAFYLYPDFEPFRHILKGHGVETSEDLARLLLEEMQISTLPGTAFGDGPNDLRLRIACCDYDGEKALAYYADNPDSRADELVEACCSNILLACQRLQSFF